MRSVWEGGCAGAAGTTDAVGCAGAAGTTDAVGCAAGTALLRGASPGIVAGPASVPWATGTSGAALCTTGGGGASAGPRAPSRLSVSASSRLWALG
jgi:hypothetical protein